MEYPQVLRTPLGVMEVERGLTGRWQNLQDVQRGACRVKRACQMQRQPLAYPDMTINLRVWNSPFLAIDVGGIIIPTFSSTLAGLTVQLVNQIFSPTIKIGLQGESDHVAEIWLTGYKSFASQHAQSWHVTISNTSLFDSLCISCHERTTWLNRILCREPNGND